MFVDIFNDIVQDLKIHFLVSDVIYQGENTYFEHRALEHVEELERCSEIRRDDLTHAEERAFRVIDLSTC